jgi:hypothetical protein
MPSTFRRLTLFLGATALMAPALLTAQPPQGGPGGRGGPGGPGGPAVPGARGAQGPRRAELPGADVTALLNARRQLDLTPRQVAQLDSLERIQHAERSKFQESMRARRDSAMQRQRAVRAQGGAPGAGAGASPMSRDSLRARMQAQVRTERAALQPQLDQMRRRDSTFRMAADRVLNDTQRQKVREMQAERRGYERGLRERRGGQAGRGAIRDGRDGRDGRAGRAAVRGGQGARGGMRPAPNAGPRPPMGPERGPVPPGGERGRRPNDAI